MSRSGLWSQVGYAKEVTYGTRVAAAKFLPFISESLKLSREYVDSTSLRAGRLFQDGRLSKATTRAVAGSLRTELLNQGMSGLFDLFHGAVTTPTLVAPSTTVYKHTHNIGTSTGVGKSLTVQVGKPQTAVAPTVSPFDYVGLVAVGLQIEAQVNQLATVEWTFDGRDEKTDQTLVAAAYPTDLRAYDFTEGAFGIGGSPAGNVKSVQFQVQNQLATDRYFLGNTGLKARPIPNGYTTAEFTAELEFDSLATYNAFANGTNLTNLELKFEGATIDAPNSLKESITIKAALAQIRGETPVAAGPDLLSFTGTFRVLDDGTNPPVVIEVVSTEAAI